MMETLRDLAGFLAHNKKFWLLPIVLTLLLLGVLFSFGQSSVLLPFVYPLF